jgi:hypothetical protein
MTNLNPVRPYLETIQMTLPLTFFRYNCFVVVSFNMLPPSLCGTKNIILKDT